MTNDSTRVVFRLEADPLLLGVLCSAVEFQGRSAGLAPKTCVEFAKAAEDICRNTIPQLAEAGDGLDVSLETFHDRIELSIHHHGPAAPVVGLESFAFCESEAGDAGRFNGLELLSKVDRVLFNTEDGVACTTLVKFLHPNG